eukprot:CAMPEP_0202884436 /NCGR_PEP_ID=MMETSP1391-20130828/40971_1 /ASSEMBLY_ACC=CAM_ASM_000867 /TAXON_ID=1034604 /ORGANISM="Chlamydomonas leiostraca, Strain SAG 11-49" /LENGTH=160 /DNA_ID=CAMNT_0049567629 /DNA_START=463 /DNA_END=945 /DNA_ORIENTATION=-
MICESVTEPPPAAENAGVLGYDSPDRTSTIEPTALLALLPALDTTEPGPLALGTSLVTGSSRPPGGEPSLIGLRVRTMAPAPTRWSSRAVVCTSWGDPSVLRVSMVCVGATVLSAYVPSSLLMRARHQRSYAVGVSFWTGDGLPMSFCRASCFPMVTGWR